MIWGTLLATVFTSGEFKEKEQFAACGTSAKRRKSRKKQNCEWGQG
jgi:hypothetical protein